nr:MAG TPA: ERF superfamily protein [Caudoviricetes sp.]
MDKKVNSPEANAPAAEKQQIDVHKLNVYQKLILARKRFLERNVKKSGVNRQLEFQYFELQDIVPSATRIFQNLGLLGVVQFPPVEKNADTGLASEPVATMTVLNTDRPSEAIEFMVPYREVEQIKSNAGKSVTNPLQALGSSVTYLRRYLWMLAMDIVEQDDVDAMMGQQEPQAKTPTSKPTATQAAAPKKQAKPATSAEREAVKVSLTQPDEQADPLMIKGLKAALNTLRQKDDKQDEFIQHVAEATVGFAKITRTQCEELTKKVNSMIEEYDKK